MTPEEARRRFGAARVARLATVSHGGRPHLVPVVFALEGDVVYSAVDHKPKRSSDLQRLTNITARPEVTLLVDHYEDADWDALWWVRADGTAAVTDAGSTPAEVGRRLLVERYPQYRARPPNGPVIAVEIHRWLGWEASPTGRTDR